MHRMDEVVLPQKVKNQQHAFLFLDMNPHRSLRWNRKFLTVCPQRK
jgi:hypothetical protein